MRENVLYVTPASTMDEVFTAVISSPSTSSPSVILWSEARFAVRGVPSYSLDALDVVTEITLGRTVSVPVWYSIAYLSDTSAPFSSTITADILFSVLPAFVRLPETVTSAACPFLSPPCSIFQPGLLCGLPS